ncbi:hypothetical protein SAMN02745216_03897 [Desulfatibacillum alkenivorans DSM 16219]|jgi:hypothetical protein|uniref:O-antigen ligase-related domain-containing protein n=1 Tax=Desulfatibacillum alkenivorans DSM 16219 TaxID=1121393 RepID=A0A1M6UG78_9BACT|nr:O-antigen ligase family protein [Desulfatibacillum alkenivorans]SHK68187.1 hypothetical protein SAMN02745216_03897 [Desulfatibacillum alkenivorans DSM 16219]
MLIPLILFAIVSGLGVWAYFRPKLWAHLLAFIAFLPSSCLFYGINDYAIRAGILTWLFWGLIQKRAYSVKWFSVISLWAVMAIGGSLVTYYRICTWPPILIYVFTHSGFSFLYVLLISVIIPGRVNLEQYLISLVICMTLFFAIGGIIQYIAGSSFRVSSNSAMYLSEGFNYLSEFNRMVGIFQTSSHVTATVLNVGFALVFARMQYKSKPGFLNIIILVMIVLGIVLCQNRGNYLAVTVVLILWLFFTQQNKRKIFISIGLIFTLFIIISMLPLYMSHNNISRFSDPKNVIQRLNIYKNAWILKDNMIKERAIGTGFLPVLYYGSIDRAFHERRTWLSIGENQFLMWIEIYGWIITIFLCHLSMYKIISLYMFLKKSINKNNNYVGWGLFFSWVSLFIAYLPNHDTKFLIPLLFALTGIYRQEKDYFERVALK